MATAAVVTDLVANLITACDSTTADGSWSGVSVAVTTSDPSPLQGTGCLGGIYKSTIDSSNDSFFAKTGGINLLNKHLRWQLFTALAAVLDPDGIDLILGDGTNEAYYNVSGDKYIGKWETLVLDTNVTPYLGTAPTNMAALTYVGIIFRLAAAAKNVTTAWHDYITAGNGFQAITGGTSGDEIAFSHIAAQDVFYKIFEIIGGIYRSRGELVFGDEISTGSIYFKDPGKVLMFDNLRVADALYKVKVVGNATGVSYVDFSGIFMSATVNPWLFDSTDTDVDYCPLDGTTIQNATTGVKFGTSTHGVGTIIDASGAVEPGLATLSSFVIKNSPAAAALLLPVSHNMGSGAFISAGTGHAISGYAAAGDYTLTDWVFTGYAATDGVTGNEAIYVTATTGIVNLSISGGTTPSIRTAGATVNVIPDPIVLTIKGWISGSKLIIYDDDSADPQELGTELQRNDNITANETFVYFNPKIADDIVIVMIPPTNAYKIIQDTVTLGASSADYTLKPIQETN